jgi:hypothetical protein
MVAPGDCSPSRSVVSKIKTRSFSERFAAGELAAFEEGVSVIV